jgi:hypothetical protein
LPEKIQVTMTILRIAVLSSEPSLYTCGIGDTHDKLPYRYVVVFDCVCLVSACNWLESLHTLPLSTAGLEVCLSIRCSFVCLTQDECDPVVSSCFAGFTLGTDCFFIRYMNVLHDTIIKSRFNDFCMYILQMLPESPGYSCVTLSFHIWLIARKVYLMPIHIYKRVCVCVCVCIPYSCNKRCVRLLSRTSLTTDMK